jgi:signal transduction histidine kinase
MLATAIIMAVVFSAIYFIVQGTVMRNLDNDLSYEAEKHSGEIIIVGDSIQFSNRAELQEREHREIQVNPVFIQIIDKQGVLMDKSLNLKDDFLPFKDAKFGGHFNTYLSQRAIRQVQLPIEQNGKIKGYILAAMSLEPSLAIILKLRNVLSMAFLVVLAGLYFVSRFLAGRSTRPIKEVTNTITRITKNNLKERVALPQPKDEIYALSSGFNALLERIENAIERERQFTSYASHELRTPLATLRGTLEVLIRKARTQTEYEEKIKYSLSEIGRMTTIIEQLLLLARLDTHAEVKENNLISLPAIIDASLTHFKSQIVHKQLNIEFNFDYKKALLVPHYYSDLIIENILSNAIKYANQGSVIIISVEEIGQRVNCSIKDEGLGIREEDLKHIYENFFRSDSLNHKHITGHGLGLSIVKKCADAINAQLQVKSTFGHGTTVSIHF